jgi:putative transposase
VGNLLRIPSEVDRAQPRRRAGRALHRGAVDAGDQRGPGADVEVVHHSDRGSEYTSIDYTQMLADHGVLASVGSVGDADDNAMAESFVDSFKTELIADRVWRTPSQLELAIVEYLGWFNTGRLHQALGDRPPTEFEALAAPRNEMTTSTTMKLETT